MTSLLPAESSQATIDLILIHRGRVLVGQRRNSPVRGSYFVPGGLVHKWEQLSSAVVRIFQEEMGEWSPELTYHLYAIMDQRYTHRLASKMEGRVMGTHHVCHSVTIDLSDREVNISTRDTNFLWLKPSELAMNHLVHPYTQAYTRVDRDPNVFFASEQNPHLKFLSQ